MEVIPFAIRPVTDYLTALDSVVTVRENSDGKIFRTEQGNNILDCRFGLLEDPVGLAGKLSMKSGIVEHGLFIKQAKSVIVGGKEGIRHLKK